METAVSLPSPALADAGKVRLWRTACVGVGLALLWFVLCRQLSNEWSANEQYSYGWFVPFFAAFLFWLRSEESGKEKLEIRKRRCPRFLLPTFYLLLFLLAPIRLFELGNPDWRPLGWVHAGIVVALTLLFLARIGGGAWVRHFGFPVAFIFVAVPWITPIEAPIVQGLMRVVAAIATETLALLGLPAQLEGSVIRISSGVVGVNEACSGVRSLQTSLMVGLLFGELKRLNLVRRVALVAAAAGIAFIANCARTFFLVWIATQRGVGAVEQWHDTAGYAILGAVFLGTVGVAAWLGRGGEREEVGDRKSEVKGPEPGGSTLRTPAYLLSTFYFLLPALLLIEGAVELWYRAHERDLVATATWNVRWPESVPGFRDLKINEDVRSTLRYDRGREATWPTTLDDPTPQSEPAPAAATSSMFFFRWEPGTSSILRARAHRPDVCLPNTGWRVTQDAGVRDYLLAGGGALPFRHFTFARRSSSGGELTAHAFFCQREDRVSATPRQDTDFNAGALSNWSRSDRLRVVLEGIRNQGQQVLEIVLTTAQPVGGAEAEQWFARLVPEIVEAKN